MKAITCHAYQLEVPEGTRWHNIVHTTLFKPFYRRYNPQDIDKDETLPYVYKVDSIIDSKTNRGVVKYSMRWVRYPEFEDTWEMLYMLNNCLFKLQKFREKFTNKPHDSTNM